VQATELERWGSHNLNYVVPWPLIFDFDDTGGTAKTDE
jgi:hypothetical protein